LPNINRINWTYVGNKANKSLVEIKHFLDSGNLAIFCNGQIVITDFEIYDDAEYPFFIGEEFCKIIIKKHPSGELGYEFKIVEDIDTPLNRRRKKLSRKHLLQSFLVIFGVILLLASIMAGGYFAYQHKLAKDLRENGVTKAIGIKIKSHVDGGKFYNAFYTFRYRKQKQAGHLKLAINQAGELLAPNGLPIRENDEFLLTFSSKNSDNFRLDFDAPTEKQIERYRRRMLERMNTDSLNIHDNNCVLNAVYQLKGIDGWANLYYKNISRRENKKHHRKSYKRMIEDEKMQKLISECKKN